VEAALPYNCEHVVPQSWFGKAEPMRGDLHHLFVCETRCNSFRGNTPYTEFADFPPLQKVGTDCGKSRPEVVAFKRSLEPAKVMGLWAEAAFTCQPCLWLGRERSRRCCACGPTSDRHGARPRPFYRPSGWLPCGYPHVLVA
jgi:hypothetical protein